MIASFRDPAAEELWNTGRSRKLPATLPCVALRKLAQLHFAALLDDLPSPPGNRIEALQGDRRGRHSMRINDQYRICFVWRDGNVHEVEIVDYH